MGQHDKTEEGGESAGYVAPQPCGNGDGALLTLSTGNTVDLLGITSGLM